MTIALWDKRTFGALVLVTGFATAADATGIEGIALEIKGGSLGGGIEVNYAVNSLFTVGLGINRFSRSASETADDIDYDVDLNLRTVALLANYHPFEGTFRVTAGLMSNGNELVMKAEPQGTYEIGGTTYTAGEVGRLKATVDFKTIAPYLGVGWGKSASSGFGVTFDVGMLLQGAPNVDMKASGALADAPAFAADLKQEARNAEEDLESLTVYPVVSLGVNYRL
jgi:hypothetical protein